MRKRAPKSLVAAVFLLIIVIAYGAPRLTDRLLLPWAFNHGSRRGLPDTWVGLLTTATGRRFAVQLDLELETFYHQRHGQRDWRNSPNGSFIGTLRACDDAGGERTYTVSGHPQDRHASRLVFHAAPAEKPPRDGLTFSWFNGTWDGADRLDVNADLYWGHDGGAATSGPDYPDTQVKPRMSMVRAGNTEFRAACSKVARVAAFEGRGSAVDASRR